MGSWGSFSFVFRMRGMARLCGEIFDRFREGEVGSTAEGWHVADIKP